MYYLDNYIFWLESDYFDSDTKKELEEIKDDSREIEDRFYKELEFGTGGLRGLIGAGTNRINIYTVRKATQGFADYLISKDPSSKKKGMVIAYDSRNQSHRFAMEAAKVLAGNGIKAFVFDEMRPTPELSFAVRFLGTAGGIMITASHNPKQYNGYKAYGEDGAQLGLDESKAVTDHIAKLKDISDVKLASLEEAEKNGLIRIIGKDIDDDYIYQIKSLSTNSTINRTNARDFRIVYTPLHGAGSKPVRRILTETGFDNILVVPEQELPDPEFSTVNYPNPEDKNAFKLAQDLASKNDADLIIGTDPDCDRVGVMVRTGKGGYEILTGNQTGCLLLDYILSRKRNEGVLPANGFTVKTIVTTELAKQIAECYGIEMIEVLTGFKFIGEKIKELDEFGDKKFIFGFEESYGYLAGTFVRDKDGVSASMLIAEMAAHYHSQGKSLFAALQELYGRFGYYADHNVSFTLEGKEGLERINGIMEALRKNHRIDLGPFKVKAVRDYKAGVKYDIASNSSSKLIGLPKSNVLYYEIHNGDWFCIRPSGTEPKIKVYIGAKGDSSDAAESKMLKLKGSIIGIIKKLADD